MDQGAVLGETQLGRLGRVNGNRRIARCECGAMLEGDSEGGLYEAVQLHLAQHHPQLLGAMGLDVVLQMAEDVGGTDANGVVSRHGPGATNPRAGGDADRRPPGRLRGTRLMTTRAHGL